MEGSISDNSQPSQSRTDKSVASQQVKRVNKNQIMKNMSFNEGFAQLSLDLDCVIHEEIKEESSNNNTTSSDNANAMQ
jgi:hypothetical protein